MAKIRLKKKKVRYATVSRDLLANPNISLKAKGLGAWLELHQDGFELNFEFILKNMKEGKSALRQTLKELREEDFLITIQTRNKKGKFETTWVFDSEGSVKDMLSPPTDFQESDKRESDLRESVNRTQIRKLNNKTKKKTLSREKYLKSFDSFISYLRANFINKEIVKTKDLYTEKIIRLSITNKGMLYDMNTSENFQAPRAKELYASLYNLAKEGKIKNLKENNNE